MRDLILNTALRMFNEQGYIEVGMRQIARQLDISPGNLTYHFKKKEDILFALLQQFSGQNSQFYEEWTDTEAGILNFLGLMKNILGSQYQYRGVYIGNQVVQAELQGSDRFNYQNIAERRKAAFAGIFRDLGKAGDLAVNEDDISFLVSFMTLFGRFWISEATLFNKSPEPEATIAYYLQLLAKELSLFATPTGREKIEAFLRELRA